MQGSNGDTGTQNTLMNGGEEGEGGMHGDSNMATRITICKIESQWEFAVWLRELNLGLWNNLERWEWVLGEGDSRGRGHMYMYG